ncbi:hypothetical protein [Brevundimonas sp.]|uniref:hypothetical protein n=1 Tax=Brevundimonas sp. TaxID=1871086 RepID=UPI0035B038A7
MREPDTETVIIREPTDTVVVERTVPVREPANPAVWFLIGLLVIAILIGLAWLFTREDEVADDALIAAQTEAAIASSTAQQAVIEANAARADAALSDARARLEASSAAAARAAEAAVTPPPPAVVEVQAPPPVTDTGGSAVVTTTTPQP